MTIKHCDCKGCQNEAVISVQIPRYRERSFWIVKPCFTLKEIDLCERHAKKIAHFMELLDLEREL